MTGWAGVSIGAGGGTQRAILGGSTAGSRGGGGAVILGGSTAGGGAARWRGRSDLGRLNHWLARWRGRRTACRLGILRSDLPHCERRGRLRWYNSLPRWGGLKINNGTPTNSRRFRRRWLLVVEVPAQWFSRRGSTRRGRVGKIAPCCLWLRSNRTWLKWSSGARRTHHNAVSAISLSEAERAFSDI